MTRLITTGFELANISIETDVINDCSIVAAKRSGNYSLQINDGNSRYARWYLYPASPITEIYGAFAVFVTSSGLGGDPQFIRIVGNAGIEATINKNVLSTGAMTLTAGGQSSVSNGGILYEDTWVHFEFHYKLSDTVGEFTLKTSGNTIAQITGDTNTLGSSYINYFEVFSYYSITRIDDLIINDTLGSTNNFWIGSPRLILAVPNATGTYTQWSASVGENYECVDEIPISSSDYVYTQATGTILDTYNITNPLSGTEIINNVIINTVGALDSGTGSFRPVLYLNGSEYYGMTGTLSEATMLFQSLWNENPDTTAPWEPSDIIDLEIGQETI